MLDTFQHHVHTGVMDDGHQWIRTVPTDGRWCELCGLSEARDRGDGCPGQGAAREVERRMMSRLADVWDAGFRAAYDFEPGTTYPEPTNPYRRALAQA